MIKFVSLSLMLIYIASEFFSTNSVDNSHIFFASLWLLSAMFVKEWKMSQILSTKRYLFVYAFLLYFYISNAIGSSYYQAFVNTIYEIRLFLPILMFDFVVREKKQIRYLISSIIFVYIFVYTYNVLGLVSIVGEDRGLKSEISRHGEDLYLSNVFAYVYMIPVLITTLASIARQITRECAINIFSIATSSVLFLGAILFVYIAIRSLFMTAIVISFVGLIVSLFYSKNDKKRIWILKSIISVLILCVIFVFNIDFIKEYAHNNGSVGTEQRVEEISSVIMGESEKAYDYSSRSELRAVSFNTFLSHPIFGVHHTMVGKVDEKRVGNHAQWVDDLARYGIFAFLLFVFFYKTHKVQRSEIAFWIYVVLGFLNPIVYPLTSITVFLLTPLLYKSFLPKD